MGTGKGYLCRAHKGVSHHRLVLVETQRQVEE